MREIYQTEGVVVGGSNFGEASRVVTIFTREFGMVKAVARGVRQNKSKLRYSLQNYSLVRASLVRGREAWHLVDAQEELNLSMVRHDPSRLRLLARVVSLLRRLVHGETAGERMFTDLKSFLIILSGELTDQELSNLELVMVIRILHQLGYLEENKLVQPIVTSRYVTREIVWQASPLREAVASIINRSFKSAVL